MSDKSAKSNEITETRSHKALRVVALAGVILLVGMVIATFVVAVWNFEGSGTIFKGLVCCDVAIPILLWGYIVIYRAAARADKSFEKQAIEELEKENKL